MWPILNQKLGLGGGCRSHVTETVPSELRCEWDTSHPYARMAGLSWSNSPSLAYRNACCSTFQPLTPDSCPRNRPLGFLPATFVERPEREEVMHIGAEVLSGPQIGRFLTYGANDAYSS